MEKILNKEEAQKYLAELRKKLEASGALKPKQKQGIN